MVTGPANEASSGKREPILRVVLRVWTRRVGPEAAAYRVACYRLELHALISGVFGILLLLIGGFTGVVTLAALGGIAVVGWLVMSVKAFMKLRLMNKAISAALGIDNFGFFATPPSWPNKYRVWCAKMGVSPYPFDDIEPPAVRTRWFW